MATRRFLSTIVFVFVKRTGYFWHGRLDWNYHSLAGKYVREICKPLYVSIECRLHVNRRLLCTTFVCRRLCVRVVYIGVLRAFLSCVHHVDVQVASTNQPALQDSCHVCVSINRWATKTSECRVVANQQRSLVETTPWLKQ